MKVLNNKIFVEKRINVFFGFIGDYEPMRKVGLIEQIYSKCHRGANAIYNGIKEKYYNITQSDEKAVSANCNFCSQREVTVEIETGTLIVIINKLERLQVDITYMEQYAKMNNGFKFVLTVIDCEIKFACRFFLSRENSSAGLYSPRRVIFTLHCTM